ncbi:MAG TPA: DUF4390 domain-containing protein [Casimicrobiaceae bacterium]|nr:DUF4390 domain-containing protein [Casimicrobiaceae bacterium]
MPFALSIPALFRTPPTPRRRLERLFPKAHLATLLAAVRSGMVAVWVVAAVGLVAAQHARADTIAVKAAELRIEEGEVLLNAEFEFSLNPTLEDALQKGIPLYFLIDFELTRGRWYWLDEKVAQTALVYRVSYNALTRQYRVASGLLTQAFNSLEEVERFIGRITSRPVAPADALSKGTKYEAAVRLRLDVNQLPKPFQVSALANREWTLASEWQRWSFTP